MEGLALCVWLALAGMIVYEGGGERVVRAIDPKALTLGPSQERWMDLLRRPARGLRVVQSAPITGGGTIFEGDVRVATFEPAGRPPVPPW